MPHAYVDLTTLKARLSVSDTTDDAVLRGCIEAASVALDNGYNRRFQPYQATRYYTAETPLLLPVNDLLSVTSLKTLTSNSSGSRVYGNTWAATDYDLEPYDAPDDREPYTQIWTNPSGSYTFPSDRRGVEIIGTWGYGLDVVAASTAAEAMDATETGYDVTSGAAFAVGQTIRADDEQMYITGIATNTLTVERGVNGTTAATHETGITLYRYRYPSPVSEAAVILAARLFRRKDAPFGVLGSPEFGLERIAADDPDVKRMMRPYARFALAAV